MYQKREKAKPLFMILLFIIQFIFFYPNNISAANNEIDISTNPGEFLFKVDNLKPGDWMPREIEIRNIGTQNFLYTSFAEKKSSYKNLYENLTLEIKDNTNLLYTGLLKDFKGFHPRFLKSGQSEKLTFTVTMPYELGNEFQGSSADVEFKFVAEGRSTPPPVDCTVTNTCEPPPQDCKVTNTCPPPIEDCNVLNTCNPPETCEGVDCEPPVEECTNSSDCNPPTEECEEGTDCNLPDEDDEAEQSDDDERPKPGQVGTGINEEQSNENNPHNDDSTTNGTLLPDTATNNYNLLLIGGLMTLIGGALLLFRRKKDH